MQGFQFYSVQFKPTAFAFGTAVVSSCGKLNREVGGFKYELTELNFKAFIHGDC